jgi:hypothetical protein
MGGAPEASPAETPPGGEVTPEGFNKNDLNYQHLNQINRLNIHLTNNHLNI